MEEIKLSVVIPTYNRKTKLKNLLLSIEKNFQIKSLYEIIVIDDASTDGTDEMIRKEFTYVKYYRHNNIGLVGKSRNDGIHFSSGDLILFIDDDNQLIDDSIGEIVTYMGKHPDVGVMAPVTCYLSDPNTIMYAGSKFSTIIKKTVSLYEKKKFSTLHDQILEVDAIANCSIINRKLAIDVGLIDYPKYPFIFEDGDLIYKIKKSGYKIMTYGNAKTLHDYPICPDIQYIKKRYNSMRSYYNIRSKIFFLKDFNKRFTNIFLIPGYYFAYIFEMISKGNFNLKNFKALTYGLIDGIYNKYDLKYY